MEKYKQLARELKLDDRVRFVGRAENSEMLARYFSEAQGLIVPSVGSAESFSLVTIEALSSGCPVIASDIPGVRDRIVPGKDGLLFDATSLIDLQAKIVQLAGYSRAKRDERGAAGRQKVLLYYQWKAHGEMLEKVYNEVCHP